MKRILQWVSGLSGVALFAAVGAAIMMVLRAYQAGKMEVKIEHQEGRVLVLEGGTNKDIIAAKRLQNDIASKKIEAREIRKKSEASLERIGQDETMADIAKRFNGKRVRSRTDSTPEVRGG